MALTESRLRQIIRQETNRVLREAQDPRLESRDTDVAVWQIIRGLRDRDVQDVYPEASSLLRKLERMELDFADGMAVVRPSESGGNAFDIFVSYYDDTPINDMPIPGRAFFKMGILLNRGYLSSAEARRRGREGF